MQDILFEYELNPATWVYLSSLMTIGIYFKFRRFWSVRNLDLIGLIAFSPGLLLVYHGLKEQLEEQVLLGQWLERFGEQCGYIWLFSVGAFFLIRLLLDPIVVRRPLLEPNLSADGLTFTGIVLLVVLMSNVINPKPAQRLEHVLVQQDVAQQQAAQQEAAQQEVAPPHAPGDALFRSFAGFSDEATIPSRTAAILGHLAVVIGVVLVGYRHFDNIQTGVAVASLYLLLPYTAQMTSRVDHVIPAALLVWAVAAYRRPVVAGILIGLAAGVIYPLFLLPLWCGFYWRRGLYRFVIGVTVGLVLVVTALVFAFGSLALLINQLQQMFWPSVLPEYLAGFWNHHEPYFRIPVYAAFVALCGSLALWPAQKNLGTLLSCSAAVMLGTQFWHVPHGGLYMAWYLPLLLLTVFRPNLEDRVAISALTEGRVWWRRVTDTGNWLVGKTRTAFSAPESRAVI